MIKTQDEWLVAFRSSPSPFSIPPFLGTFSLWPYSQIVGQALLDPSLSIKFTTLTHVTFGKDHGLTNFSGVQGHSTFSISHAPLQHKNDLHCWFQIPKIIIAMNHFAMLILHYNVGETRVDVITMSVATYFPHQCHDSIHINAMTLSTSDSLLYVMPYHSHVPTMSLLHF